MDIASFFRGRLDEDEQTARGLINAAKMFGAKPNFYGAGGPAAEAFWRRFDPARVLADVASKRGILDQHLNVNDGDCGTCVVGQWGYPSHGGSSPEPWPCETLRLLALPYREHLDYRPEWAPRD